MNGDARGLARIGTRGSPVLLAIGAALVIGTIVCLGLGVAPRAVGERLISGIVLSPYGWGQVLYKTTFLTFTGLAVALAFGAGLFNIGAEGQAVAGSLVCALVAIAGARLPGMLLLPLAIAGAFAGGALWGLLPGWLKARWGAHEVIVTIMLNFIALALSNFVVTRYLGLPETVRTAEIASGATLPRLDGLLPGMRGSAVNASLLLAILCAGLAHVWLHHTASGLTLRAVGQGRRQSELLGIAPGRRILLAFALAGGCAGLVGTNFVLGYKHYYEDGFSGGIGFLGIGVALLARNEPLAVLPAALLFGFLSQAGFVVNALLPRELVDILTGVILLVFICADRRRGRRAHRGAPAASPEVA